MGAGPCRRVVGVAAGKQANQQYLVPVHRSTTLGAGTGQHGAMAPPQRAQTTQMHAFWSHEVVLGTKGKNQTPTLRSEPLQTAACENLGRYFFSLHVPPHVVIFEPSPQPAMAYHRPVFLTPLVLHGRPGRGTTLVDSGAGSSGFVPHPTAGRVPQPHTSFLEHVRSQQRAVPTFRRRLFLSCSLASRSVECAAPECPPIRYRAPRVLGKPLRRGGLCLFGKSGSVSCSTHSWWRQCRDP